MSDKFVSQTVHANGQRIHVVTAGESGPLILLCHGFPESWYSWRYQLHALSEAGYRVAAMDMRGYGRSSKPTDISAYRISELVADCVGVVEALGESTAYIVGHDWGAPVAWVAAWSRPDVFKAVAGLSVPFSGRGLIPLPGSPFGERRPAHVMRELAGPDLLFYVEYFCLPGGVAERDAEKDIRSWVLGSLYSFSGSPELPEGLRGKDLTKLPEEEFLAFVRAGNCFAPGSGLTEKMQIPDVLPDWLKEEDVEFFVNEIERTGITSGLNWYRALNLSWEQLEHLVGKPITVPSFFIGGARDVVTIWSRETLERANEVLSDFRGSVILQNCGHWVQQEKPEETNAALIAFFDSVSR